MALRLIVVRTPRATPGPPTRTPARWGGFRIARAVAGLRVIFREPERPARNCFPPRTNEPARSGAFAKFPSRRRRDKERSEHGALPAGTGEYWAAAGADRRSDHGRVPHPAGSDQCAR